MSELNRDEIVKALECCIKTQCENCCNLGNWHEQWNCMTDLMRNALTLINQLTEDNTKLANLLFEKDVIILEQGKFVDENERLKTELRQTAQKLKAVEEVNEKLTVENENKCKDCAGCISDKCDCANIEAYAVEKYKSAIIQYYSQPKYQPPKEHPIKHTQIEYLFAVLDQIAKEMLEG